MNTEIANYKKSSSVLVNSLILAHTKNDDLSNLDEEKKNKKRTLQLKSTSQGDCNSVLDPDF